MSLSRAVQTSPIAKYIEWKSTKQAFQYYDKELEENVEIPLPVEFFILDELTSMKGFDTQNTCGIYSNEIHNTSKEELTVTSFKGGLIATGLYQDIKDKAVNKGAKYCKSVYAYMDGELVNFGLTGSALSFIGDLKKVNKKDHFIKVTKTIEEKTGANKYHVPVFECGSNVGSEIFDAAMTMDEGLQEYLDSRRDSSPTAESNVSADEASEIMGEGNFPVKKLREPNTPDGVPF